MHPAPLTPLVLPGPEDLVALALTDIPEPVVLVVHEGTGSDAVAVPVTGGRRLAATPADAAARLAQGPVHVLVVAAPDPADVLARLDGLDAAYLPRVLVVTTTLPVAGGSGTGSAVVDAGYVTVHADARTSHHVAGAHLARLMERASADGATDALRAGALALHAAALRQEAHAARVELDAVSAELRAWRGRAVEGWSEAAALAGRGLHDIGGGVMIDEVEAMRRTLSWRVTKPLRGALVLARKLRVLR